MPRSLPTPDFPDVVAGCLRGDRPSQTLLYRQFYGYSMGICLRYTPTREEAMEVLNDGFMKVFTKLEQYDINQPFKNWLRRILINTALDHYRHSVKHYYHDLLDETLQVASEAVDAYGQLAHEEMITMIQQLSPAYRLVFNLYAIDGFNHEEIAAQLGISVGASKSNLARAREKLRVMLEKKSRTAKSQDKYARIP